MAHDGNEPDRLRDDKPLYAQIKDFILDGIAGGRYDVGERVPSEGELVKRFRIARMTANRALRELTDQGVLTRTPGVGTFVAENRAQGELIAIHDIADELAEQGHIHSREVLCQERVPADRELADQFRIDLRAPLIHAKILHFRDKSPILLEDRYVNAAVAPGYLHVDLSKETSYGYLTRIAPLQEVEHVIRAVVPSVEIQELLRLDAEEPCLLVHRRTWSRDIVASVTDLSHAGSRYEIAGRFRP